jgi:hypothetical protein
MNWFRLVVPLSVFLIDNSPKHPPPKKILTYIHFIGYLDLFYIFAYAHRMGTDSYNNICFENIAKRAHKWHLSKDFWLDILFSFGTQNTILIV